MGDTHFATMGDRGRLVIPAELRSRQHWKQGDPLLLIETDSGVIVTSRAQAKALIRDQLKGTDLVASLIADRRVAAQREDAG